jgi:NADPH-dependent 2,4-dienoyl-CoA reductase/sulfur reductase-like enzyme
LREVDVLVVGGGPAGLAGALEAAQMGARVVLVDEQRELGGSYFRQRRVGLSQSANSQQREGRQLIASVRSAGVEVRSRSAAWGIFEERTVATLGPDMVADLIRGRVLILAPGAVERAIAIPGWTLPGVMTGGGALALLTQHGVLPGRRVAVCGVGPLLLRIADSLVAEGVEVVLVADAGNTVHVPGGVLGLWTQLDMLREGVALWFRLRQRGVRVRSRRIPIRIEGRESAEGVVIAAVDAVGEVVPGSEEHVEADAVLLSFGFAASTELARLAGCPIVWQDDVSSWAPVRDSVGRTGVQGVLVCGAASGYAGGPVAMIEGRVAGIVAARQASYGDVGESARLRRLQLRADRVRAAARRMALSTKPAGVWASLVTDATILCRCEDVTADQVLAALRSGDTSLRTIKVLTRVGMGPCRGQTCWPIVGDFVCRQTGRRPGELHPDTVRPPLRPVPIGSLVSLATKRPDPVDTHRSPSMHDASPSAPR